ncbi:MAG: hypothetical protein ACE363_08410 [Alphaproteobacteria bacterium]
MSDIADARNWSIVATVAHIFFEPGTHKRRKNCIFIPYLGRNYRRAFDLNDAIVGDYVPWAQPGIKDFMDDWALIAIGARLDRFGSALKPLTHRELVQKVKITGPIQGGVSVTGYNSSERKQTVSRKCSLTRLPKRYDGPVRNKLYFTNCDAKSGASGGAVAALLGDDFYLIGMYSGHYWRSKEPQASGRSPADGAPFHPHRNANVLRIFDDQMVEAIHELVAR